MTEINLNKMNEILGEIVIEKGRLSRSYFVIVFFYLFSILASLDLDHNFLALNATSRGTDLSSFVHHPPKNVFSLQLRLSLKRLG